MPRGVRKPVDFAAQIAEIEKKIAGHKDAIKMLNKEKASITRASKSSTKAGLLQIVADSKLTAEELAALIAQIKK